MIKKKVVNTILENPIEVKLGRRKYIVPPASTEMIIRISELIPMDEMSSDGDIATEVFRLAKKMRCLGDIFAVMLIRNKGMFVCWRRRRVAKMALNLEPSIYLDYFTKIIATAGLTDFFAITAFLLETNVLRPTREAEITTVSGR